MAELSAATIRTAAEGTTLADPTCRGLRITIGKRTRSWSYRYRDGDRLVQVKLGAFPAVSIEAARLRWAQIREQRAEGIDPAAERAKAKEQAKAQAVVERAERVTVASVVAMYLEQVRKNRQAKAAHECERLFRTRLGKLSEVPAVQVDRPMAREFLLGQLNGTKTLGPSPAAARVMRQELRAAWTLALDSRLLPPSASNPWIDQLKSDRRIKPGRGKRVLSDAEAGTLLAWISTNKMSQDVQDVLNLTLRLGVRSGEAVSAEWRDIDLERGEWRLRPEATKTEQGRTIILPPQVLAIFKRRAGCDRRFVFPSPVPGQHITQKAVGVSVWTRRSECPIPAWAVHDLRRTARTGWARLGYRDEIAEAGLGHSRAGIQGTYDLHRYEVEVGEMLVAWNQHLDGLLT